LLEEFLIFGGYPKVVLSKSREDKIKELRDIFNSYIRKDINSLSRRLDAGFILENYVLGEIVKANLSLYKLNFWRKKMGAEVDFIFQNNMELIPTEVKYQNFNQNKLSTPSGLKSFIEEYSVSKATIINNNLSLRKKLNKTLIDFVPHYFVSQWLKNNFIKV